jgi:peroxiredoxin
MNGLPVTLDALRGRVVVIGAFDTVSPACEAGLAPQLQRVARTFHGSQVQVLGLHVPTPAGRDDADALAEFVARHGWRFPVATDAAPAPAPDQPDDADAPTRTMAAFGLSSTPSLILLDRRGVRRQQSAGAVCDLALGAAVMSLVMEPATPASTRGLAA